MGYNLNERVIIKPSVTTFHHGETPYFSLAPVLSKLQRGRTYGIIRQCDPLTGSIGVHFAGRKELLWFKEYELVRLGRVMQ